MLPNENPNNTQCLGSKQEYMEVEALEQVRREHERSGVNDFAEFYSAYIDPVTL